MHPLRKLALLALAGIASLVAFEAHAVWQTDSRTGDILAAALSKPQPLGVEQLSARQIDVLLAVEDPAFHDHSGIDVASPGQGMTTITQALVKFLYFDPFEPGFAKIEQSLIAWLVLDRRLDKQQQLALFLNQAYFGTRDGIDIRGFAEASSVYFGKPVADLSEDEYIGLVAMLIGPNALTPDRHADAHRERVERIKRLVSGAREPAGVFDPWYEGCA